MIIKKYINMKKFQRKRNSAGAYNSEKFHVIFLGLYLSTHYEF